MKENSLNSMFLEKVKFYKINFLFFLPSSFDEIFVQDILSINDFYVDCL